MASSKTCASRAAMALALSAAPFGITAASAQTTPEMAPEMAPETTNAEVDSAGIADIVVTAQRRAESAQDVPISLQSFSSEALARTAVRNTEDLTAVVGGMLIQPSAARPTVFVRGVGTNSSNTTPAVLTFVDGVYYPFGQSTELVNVASVEVLKGPQGTLFGRNATGGVIQITTRPPSETLGAKVEIGYGNYETVDTMAYVTGGLVTGLAMDVALRYSNQGNGFGTNVFNGEDVFFTNKFAGRTRLRAELSDVTNLTLSADYSQVRGTVGTNVSPAAGYGTLFVAGAIRRRGPGEFYPGTYDVNAGPRSPSFRAKEWGVSGTFETEFSDITFRSITAYRESEEHIFIDFDGGPASTINLTIDREPRTSFTQELQLLSSGSGPFEWVAGAFYYRGKAQIAGFELNAQEAFSTDIDESVAVYGQGSYEILPDTKLTLGGRYTIEKRSIDGFVLVNGVEAAGRTGRNSQKFKEPTWRIALDHNLSENALVYASVSRGFNAGFFNQSSLAGFATEAQNPPVLPEFLTAYEVGAKTDLLDRRLRVNVAAFLYDYKGLQQQIYDQGAVKTINAGSAKIQGIDFEITALPVPSLTLSLSGTFLDSKYKSYPLAPDYVPQPNGSIIAGGNVDAKGNTITNAPKISYTASISHVLSTSIGEFTTSANLNYRGKTWVDPANRFKLPTRYLLNVTERWTDPTNHYFISIWAKNLLDKHYDYAINILTPAGLVGNVAPPRTYGASVGFEF
ncbi:MAG TPA: TonB-dependent receptor [Novosphingobium sp.]|nr:TonB-dependent receptor [Novosphingobium sp.]